MRCTEETLTPAASAIAAPVQCAASASGGSIVSATARWAKAGSSFLMREGRVLSRSRPSKPSAAKRSCKRQTQVLDLPVSCTIAFVPAHDPGAPNMLLWSAPISNQRAKPIKIGGEDGKGNAPSRPPDSHPANQPGIPKGIQNIRFDPLVLSVLWGWITGSSASAAAIASHPVGPRHLRWPRSD
jgi:hypothetical protein